ncbi:hypothetical protein [Micromonospora sp. NPDC126480]
MIHQLVEDQVWRMPGGPVLSYAGATMTYQELNATAETLGRGCR